MLYANVSLAASWIELGTTPTLTYYTDLDRAIRVGDIVDAYTLINFSSPLPQSGLTADVHSLIVHEEYNCITQDQKTLDVTTFDRMMGIGASHQLSSATAVFWVAIGWKDMSYVTSDFNCSIVQVRMKSHE